MISHCFKKNYFALANSIEILFPSMVKTTSNFQTKSMKDHFILFVPVMINVFFIPPERSLRLEIIIISLSTLIFF